MPKDIPEPDTTAASGIPWMLPDRKICRTKTIGRNTTFGECLIEGSESCAKALVLETGKICTHPNWRTFIPPEP
jgi:hypothetical protein